MLSTKVLITGATSGIGRATALELAQRGYTVFASGRREEALQQLVAEAAKPNLIPIRLDVTDQTTIEQAVAEIDSQTNGMGIDVLINNAGYGLFGPGLEISDKALRQVFDVNVFGLMAVTRAFAEPMMQRGNGRIINLSSVAGRVVFPFGGAYNASKFSVEALSDALRMELAPFGVKVILIEPGAIRTAFDEVVYRTSSEFLASNVRYRPYVEAMEKFFGKNYEFAPEPDVVVKAIINAMETRRPKARYTLPFKDYLMVLFFRTLLPTWVTDAIVLAAMKRVAAQHHSETYQMTSES